MTLKISHGRLRFVHTEFTPTVFIFAFYNKDLGCDIPIKLPILGTYWICLLYKTVYKFSNCDLRIEPHIKKLVLS